MIRIKFAIGLTIFYLLFFIFVMDWRFVPEILPKVITFGLPLLAWVVYWVVKRK